MNIDLPIFSNTITPIHNSNHAPLIDRTTGHKLNQKINCRTQHRRQNIKNELKLKIILNA